MTKKDPVETRKGWFVIQLKKIEDNINGAQAIISQNEAEKNRYKEEIGKLQAKIADADVKLEKAKNNLETNLTQKRERLAEQESYLASLEAPSAPIQDNLFTESEPEPTPKPKRDRTKKPLIVPENYVMLRLKLEGVKPFLLGNKGLLCDWYMKKYGTPLTVDCVSRWLRNEIIPKEQDRLFVGEFLYLHDPLCREEQD